MYMIFYKISYTLYQIHIYKHRTKIYSEQKILRYWQQLQSYSDFCDVTLVCDNKSIKTHKFMILNTVVNNVTVKKLQNVVCNNIYILFMKEFNCEQCKYFLNPKTICTNMYNMS